MRDIKVSNGPRQQQRMSYRNAPMRGGNHVGLLGIDKVWEFESDTGRSKVFVDQYRGVYICCCHQPSATLATIGSE
jgi:hypothetical protein